MHFPRSTNRCTAITTPAATSPTSPGIDDLPMSERVRKPLFEAAKPAEAAVAYADDPTAMLEAHYQRVWGTSMHDMPFVNPAPPVAAIGFRRHEGDWVGAVLTPWFSTCSLPGGGIAMDRSGLGRSRSNSSRSANLNSSPTTIREYAAGLPVLSAGSHRSASSRLRRQRWRRQKRH